MIDSDHEGTIITPQKGSFFCTTISPAPIHCMPFSGELLETRLARNPGDSWFLKYQNMQLHISPSLRHVTVLPTKGVKEFIKFRIVSRRLSYRVVFYSLLLFTFLLRFVFLLTAVDTIDGESKCSGIGNACVLPI